MKHSHAHTPHINQILCALLAAFLPLLLRLRPWITLWSLGLWGYMYLRTRYHLPLPGNVIRHLLTFIGFAGVFITSGRTIGGDAYTGLLAIMAGLKPLEIRNHRDRMITLFLAYFLVIASLLLLESLLIILYMFPAVCVITGVLIHINDPGSKMRENLRLAGIIMLQAIPLTLILFLLFPRIQGSLWGFSSQQSSSTGLSNTLRPGDISDLVRNQEIAFRARFQGDIPRRSALYWRGIVFWYFDGRGWHRRFKAPHPRSSLTGKEPVTYTINMVSHQERRLVILDLPISLPDQARMLDDYTAYARGSPMSRYKATSYLQYNTGPLREWERRTGLQLPEKGNPKARSLAREWVRQTERPEEIVSAGFDFFKENQFRYSLQPPLLAAKDPVDDFLFNTRVGYCEHYASAFAFLMRAANIPCRIVGGYQGGEENPYGNYLIIRQSHAHAWTEVWLSDKGWTRVDPTAAISPERIETGLADALSADEFSSVFRRFGIISEYWNKFTFAWDTLSAQFDMWFAGYSYLEQKLFLSELGIQTDSWKALAKGLFLAMGLIAGLTLIFSWFIFRRSALPEEEVQKIYERFCDKLARIGLARHPAQGPSDYAKMVKEKRTDLKAQVNEISEVYIQLRYQEIRDPDLLKEFRRLVKDFHPKKIYH